MTTDDYLRQLDKLHLTIQEITTYDVDAEQFFDNSTDSDSYVDDNVVDSTLQLVDQFDNVIVQGDDDDIKAYLCNPF